MNEIKCPIIQDVLPLYIDGVVSPDTEEMVEEHLSTCDTCQSEFELMKQELSIPIENKVSPIEKINKRWNRKKWFISLGSIFITAMILIGTYSAAFYFTTVIPYSKDLIKIEEDGHQLVSHYFGKSYAAFHGTHPMLLEIDGEMKNVSFMYYTKTWADSPTRKLIDVDKTNDKHEYTFVLPDSQEIDAVYYADWDVEKITDGEDSWDSIVKRATLIWEK